MNTSAHRKYFIFAYFAFLLRMQHDAVDAAGSKNLEVQRRLVKRGQTYSSDGNNWGPPVHVASSVLQLQNAPTHNQATVPHYPSAVENAWQPTGLSPGYEVWLASVGGVHNAQPTQSVHSTSIGGTHIVGAGGGGVGSGATSGGHTGSVFSSDPHVISGLHTQIFNSAPRPVEQNVLHLSDNVDFNNVADLKESRHALSHGK